MIKTIVGCSKCKHISCVCSILKEHKPDCAFKRSATCPVPIECDHGYDVCRICDPCYCFNSESIS
jgi:hypothetical protein